MEVLIRAQFCALERLVLAVLVEYEQKVLAAQTWSNDWRHDQNYYINFEQT